MNWVFEGCVRVYQLEKWEENTGQIENEQNHRNTGGVTITSVRSYLGYKNTYIGGRRIRKRDLTVMYL